jgi:hypothetical protein
MIASETRAMTDVSDMVQKLMSTCEGAMAVISCVNTEGDEHDTATAAPFDEAASSLEELGFVHEVTLDGVVFSKSYHCPGGFEGSTSRALGPTDPFLQLGLAPF